MLRSSNNSLWASMGVIISTVNFSTNFPQQGLLMAFFFLWLLGCSSSLRSRCDLLCRSLVYIPSSHSRARVVCQRPSQGGTSQSATTSHTAPGPLGCHQPGCLLPRTRSWAELLGDIWSQEGSKKPALDASRMHNPTARTAESALLDFPCLTPLWMS